MLSILISIVGSVAGTRSLRKMSLMIGMSELKTVFLQVFFSFVMIISTSTLLAKPHWLWILQISILVSIFWIPKLVVQVSRRVFRQNFVEILDQIILEMQSGHTFRAAFKSIIINTTGFIKVQLQDILNQIIFPENAKNHKEKYLGRIILEFKDVDQRTSKSVEQLKYFRAQLRQERDFERKKMQAKESIKAQMIILSVLYLLLGTFIVQKFGFIDNAKIFIVSAALFILGIALIHSIGAIQKWKV